jgi:hypothetical protein
MELFRLISWSRGDICAATGAYCGGSRGIGAPMRERPRRLQRIQGESRNPQHADCGRHRHDTSDLDRTEFARILSKPVSPEHLVQTSLEVHPHGATSGWFGITRTSSASILEP